MNEMIERVARAIYESRPGGGSWDALGEQRHGDYLKEKWFIAARAAISVMREPTGEMKDDGADTYRSRMYSCSLDGQPSKAWRAMIDAALDDDA